MKSSCLALALACAMPAAASAASLEVMPVLLEVAAPGATTTLMLQNAGDKPLNAQLRVFRWVQSGGQERLEPTDDVVASPPAITLKPHQHYTVRVVRTNRAPVVGEEPYRLFVDELPPPENRPGTVRLLLRHVIPVFFQQSDTSAASLSWKAAQTPRGLVLSAVNQGDRHARLSAVEVRSGGRTVSFGKGLVGYALGKSTVAFTGPAAARAIRAGSQITIAGMTATGPFNASTVVQSGE